MWRSITNVIVLNGNIVVYSVVVLVVLAVLITLLSLHLRIYWFYCRLLILSSIFFKSFWLSYVFWFWLMMIASLACILERCLATFLVHQDQASVPIINIILSAFCFLRFLSSNVAQSHFNLFSDLVLHYGSVCQQSSFDAVCPGLSACADFMIGHFMLACVNDVNGHVLHEFLLSLWLLLLLLLLS